VVYAIVVLGALLLAAVLVIVRLVVYRVTHPYTAEQFRREQAHKLQASKAIVSGKVQEHLAPLLPEMLAEFNPREARFLGSPVDFVVFDGLDEDDLRRVVFVEIKTGRSGLSTRERCIRDAIAAGLVEFRTVTLGGMSPDEEPAVAVDEITDTPFGPVEWLEHWDPGPDDE